MTLVSQTSSVKQSSLVTQTGLVTWSKCCGGWTRWFASAANAVTPPRVTHARGNQPSTNNSMGCFVEFWGLVLPCPSV